MAAAEHRLANGHEVGDGVVAIANELCAFSGSGRGSVEGACVLLGGCLR
jgi:hypothetical protein